MAAKAMYRLGRIGGGTFRPRTTAMRYLFRFQSACHPIYSLTSASNTIHSDSLHYNNEDHYSIEYTFVCIITYFEDLMQRQPFTSRRV